MAVAAPFKVLTAVCDRIGDDSERNSNEILSVMAHAGDLDLLRGLLIPKECSLGEQSRFDLILKLVHNVQHMYIY